MVPLAPIYTYDDPPTLIHLDLSQEEEEFEKGLPLTEGTELDSTE